MYSMLAITSHPVAIAATVTAILLGTVMLLARRLMATEGVVARRDGQPR
ncbi:MAG TPA: hypothetical protein VFA60_02135 [Terriglobales bacterium]|nr:hypothetical protein [Terriglobales bacterium]